MNTGIFHMFRYGIHNEFTLTCHCIYFKFTSVINKLADNNRVFMAGGELRAHDGGAFGAEAMAFIRRFQVDFAICSATAINADRGFMLLDLEEAEFSREIMLRARTRIVAADSTKLGRSGPIVVCDPSMVDNAVWEDGQMCARSQTGIECMKSATRTHHFYNIDSLGLDFLINPILINPSV